MAKKQPKPQKQHRLITPEVKNQGFFSVLKIKITDWFRNLKIKLGINELHAPTAEMNNNSKETQSYLGRMEDIEKEMINPPGWNNLTETPRGMVFIPQGTERIWKLDNKQKYLDEVAKRIDISPNDNPQYLPGEFIGEFTRIIGKCLDKKVTGMQMCIVDNNLVTLEFNNGICSLGIFGNGRETTLDITNTQDLPKKIADAYSQHVLPDSPFHAYSDMQNQRLYIQQKSPEGKMMTFTANIHHAHFNNYQDKAFVNQKNSIPSVVEVHGPQIPHPDLIHEIVGELPAITEPGHIFSLVTAMHEYVLAHDKHTQDATVFVTKDKMFCITQKENDFFLEAYCTNPQYKVAPVRIRLNAHAMEYSHQGRLAVKSAFESASHALSNQIAAYCQQHGIVLEVTDNQNPEHPDMDNDSPEIQ